VCWANSAATSGDSFLVGMDGPDGVEESLCTSPFNR
jgi:hypothetical protein